MRQNQRPIVASVVACLAVMSVLLGAQADPAVGTWKLNLAKSKYVAGPMPKSTVVTIAAAGSGFHVIAKGEDAAGKPTGIEYTAMFDGKDSPVKGAQTHATFPLLFNALYLSAPGDTPAKSSN